jgi:glutamate dehydrogenase/leucine dehydrogenase
MHNRFVTDAFIPAGGRPNTIDMHNYRHFFTPKGKPSAPLIVEGANLFVTTLAREALFKEGGVVIVKDSSANKAGVITLLVSPTWSCSFLDASTCHHALTFLRLLPSSTKSLLPCS